MKKIILGVVLIVAVSIAVTAAYINLKKTKVADNPIRATVTNIVDKPNVSEDGFYAITAQNAAGQEYRINATDYMNTPASPEEFGDSCVNIPKIKPGDKIAFNLPAVAGTSSITHTTCYRDNLTGYYFTLE